jgi:hypothetical protein
MLQAADRLTFPDNTMRDWASNHYARGAKIMDYILGASELKLEKYTTHDAFKGVSFNRAEFQKEFQEGISKAYRYLRSTYGNIQYDMIVRSYLDVPDVDEKTKQIKMNKDGTIKTKREWRTVPLAEALFGHQIMNTPEFWLKDEKGNYVYQVDAKGKPTKYHAINYKEINKNKLLLWKRELLMNVAAQLYSHRDWHSTDPRYDFRYYEKVLDVLSHIPAGVAGDEYDLRNAKVSKYFFTEEDMKWLRKISETTNWDLYMPEFFGAMFMAGKEKSNAFSDFFTTLLKKITEGIK